MSEHESTPMHWARWGDPAKAAPLSAEAAALVDAFVGTTDTPAVDESEVVLTDVLAADLVGELEGLVGPAHVHTDHEARLRRTRGKSTPDLLRLRAGDGSDSPDAVVLPADEDEVTAVVQWCVRRHVALVPFGGGTSVVGGLAARRDGFAGVIAMDLARLDRLLDVDRESMTACLQPGVRGPRAEQLLGEHGLTLGHFPQSFEYATIGGFAVTRSSGQSSAGYGRFDELVLGLRMVTPRGVLDAGRSPANAAGPDLRELVLGSEGAFGVVTAVRLRVREVPSVKSYEGWSFATFGQGAAAMRSLAQADLLPTVLRLSDETETSINLATPDSVGGESSGGTTMIVGYEGTAERVERSRREVTAALRDLGGEPLGEEAGAAWAAGRFEAPYLRDSLLDVGVLVETLETAAYWSRLQHVYDEVRAALTAELGDGALVLCHVSHVYPAGASLYFTVAAKQSTDPVAQWRAAKAAASQAMMDAGASITHHHAVGRDHLPWLTQEIGPVGVGILRAVKHELDPTGVLNPGVLIP